MKVAGFIMDLIWVLHKFNVVIILITVENKKVKGIHPFRSLGQ